MAWVPGEAVRALGRLVMRRKKERDANGNVRDGVWVSLAQLESR